MRTAVDAFGRLDALVNNAGVGGPMGLAEDVDWAEWARTIEINLMGTVLPCRAALPHMNSAGRRQDRQLVRRWRYGAFAAS